jgi:hypothetical protein
MPLKLMILSDSVYQQEAGSHSKTRLIAYFVKEIIELPLGAVTSLRNVIRVGMTTVRSFINC